MQVRRSPDLEPDPRLLPAYPLGEAARILRMPTATLSTWVSGRSYATRSGKRHAKALIRPPASRPAVLSFANLVEAHVLRALRAEHLVTMRAVREALVELRRHTDSPYPLAYENLLTGGGHVFLEKFGKLMDLNRSSQLALEETLRRFLARVERGRGFAPVRLFPFVQPETADSERLVSIDPAVAFGRPVIAGTRVPTEEIRHRIDAGDPLEDVAADFGQSEDTIRKVLVYEAA